MVIGNERVNNSYKVVTNNMPLIDKKIPLKANTGFNEILNERIKEEKLKFSKHAESRLQSRNINLSTPQMDRIIEGVDKAGAKGVRDSLILMDDVAFVVNIENRMVITAASKNELRENVFTNIDGAVIV